MWLVFSKHDSSRIQDKSIRNAAKVTFTIAPKILYSIHSVCMFKRMSLSLVFISKELVYHKVLLCLNSQDTISLYRMQWVWCEINIVCATSQFIHYIHPNILFTTAVCCTDKHNSSMQWRWVVFFLTLIKWDCCATVALVLSRLVINPCLYLWYYISCPTKKY